MSWCDLDLTLDFVVVTLTFKILSGLCLGNRKVQEVDNWGVVVQRSGVTFIRPLTLAMPECFLPPHIGEICLK